MPRQPILTEIGITGLNRWGGHVFDEFLPALRGPRGMKIYKEMSSNDPVIGAILYAAKQLIRKATWRVEPASSSRADLEAADFLRSCMDDMSMTWSDFITEMLSMIVYGWSFHEIVYKVRRGDNRDPRYNSKFNDGRIGWRKLPRRAQDSLCEWQFDDDGGVSAMVQLAPPEYKRVVIPIQKALLFRTEPNLDNPEGRSLLRNAYRPWYFKKRIEEIEGIGIERDLAGLPVLTPPEDVDLWDVSNEDSQKLRATAEALVTNIRRDRSEGVVLPFGWELKLLSTGSRRQFDTNAIINRYDQRIAITILADLVMLGADKVGSFALADVKKSMFAAGLEALLDGATEVINKYAVPRLFRLNAFPGITDYPKLRHGEIESVPLDELARFITALTGAKISLDDPATQNYLREMASMPRLPEEEIKQKQATGGGDTENAVQNEQRTPRRSQEQPPSRGADSMEESI
jgi:hypothetical protein